MEFTWLYFTDGNETLFKDSESVDQILAPRNALIAGLVEARPFVRGTSNNSGSEVGLEVEINPKLRSRTPGSARKQGTRTVASNEWCHGVGIYKTQVTVRNFGSKTM